jgi:predicted TIM-barrel fold metal-dependent hydrolase
MDEVFDCDNHYYEALDAFTRHVPRPMQPRCVQWAEIEGRKHHVVGGKISRAVKNPTWNPIAKPGAIYQYFRGNPEQRDPLEMLQSREPLPDYYMNRSSRLRKMDEQGLGAVWLFPTLGMLYEEALKADTEALVALFRGFNRWLDEDWGFAHEGRIFAAPYITLADLDAACSELEWAVGRGARVVVMRSSAVFTRSGPAPASDARFDPFWARVSEAGVTVVIHAGDSGYASNGYTSDTFTSEFSAAYRPSIKGLHIERAAYDFLLTLAYDRLFERFPRLRVASVENGSEFLADLFRKLRQIHARMPGYFARDPSALFKEHVWINPFWEDDVAEVASLMGADRVLFGSDWPHIEGLPTPLGSLADYAGFDDEQRRLMLGGNTRSLTAPPGA